jgi:WD40 repeat protein
MPDIFAWSPDLSRVTTYGGMQIWNTCSGLVELDVQNPIDNHMKDPVWSSDGAQIVWGTYTGSLCLCDANSGKPRYIMHRTSYSGHVAFAWSPQDNCVAMVDKFNIVIVPVRPWSDRSNRYFGPKVKRIIFLMMCIKRRVESVRHNLRRGLRLPVLPMALWLDMFGFLICDSGCYFL